MSEELKGVESFITPTTKELSTLGTRLMHEYSKAICFVDARQADFPVLYVNQAFETLTGYSAAEVVGRNMRFLQKDDRPQSGIMPLTHALKTKQPGTVTLRNYRKDGTLFWNEIAITPMFDADGTLTHYIGVLQDVTERKRIESFQSILFHVYQSSAIAETLEDFLYLFNQPMDHAVPGKELFVAMYDPAHGTYAVPGYTPQGEPFWQWDATRIRYTLIDYVRRTGKPLSATREIQQQLVDRGEIQFDKTPPPIWLGVPIMYEQQLYGIMVVQNYKMPLLFATQHLPLIHTTADHLGAAARQKVAHEELEKARQIAEAAVQAKSAFLANMSHEFRTPLNSIIGFSDLLLQPGMDALTGRQQSYLKTVSKSGKHLLTLINSILDLAKLESGKTTLEMRELSLSALVREACDIVRADMDKKGLKAVIDVSNQIQVTADRRSLLQILLNLLANAIKFTSEGGQVGITVTPEHEHLSICVWDTGIGIAPEDCKRIFESFHQADNSFTRQYQGTGLGLTISKSLVELHGGTIHVESKQEEGSRFIFTLPLKRENDVMEIQRAPQIQEEKHSASTTKEVLVIDDEPLNRMLSREVLEMAGWSVSEAADGAEGIQSAVAKHFDVILCDIQMPVMDGIAVLQQLRANRQLDSSVIIALTAHAMSGDAEALLKKGFDGYLSKPISIPTFVNDIMKICETRPAIIAASEEQVIAEATSA